MRPLNQPLASTISQVQVDPHGAGPTLITRKTFIEVVIEYRLQHTTQQLVSTNKAVAEIC